MWQPFLFEVFKYAKILFPFLPVTHFMLTVGKQLQAFNVTLVNPVRITPLFWSKVVSGLLDWYEFSCLPGSKPQLSGALADKCYTEGGSTFQTVERERYSSLRTFLSCSYAGWNHNFGRMNFQSKCASDSMNPMMYAPLFLWQLSRSVLLCQVSQGLVLSSLASLEVAESMCALLLLHHFPAC